MTRNTSKKATEATPDADPDGVENPTPTGSTSRDDAIRKSYGEALAALKDENLARFNELRAEKVRALGFEWSPPLTAAEKREQQLRALLEEDPSLRDKILAEQGAVNSPEQG